MTQQTIASDSIHNSEQGVQDGLTKREYFAAMAMQGIMSYPRMQQTNEKEAAFCVAMADALIEALNKEK
jgi:hypothetical protein